MSAPIPGGDELVNELRNQLAQQPWWQRFSNTVSASAGAVVLILWLAVAAGLDVPTDVLSGIASVIGVLTTLGVMKTRNGITPRGIAQVQQVAQGEPAGGYAGRHRAGGE